MTTTAAQTADPDLVETASGGPDHADLMFIFATPHWTPAEVAADLFHAGLAPTIVATGGSTRHLPGLCEAELHRSLMVARGVPHERITCESESTTTHENVMLAKPKLDQIGDIHTVLAVVKWFHRR